MAAVDGAIVRSAEWRRVRAFATPGPGQARPSLLAVSGEAGAGKSTLWRAGVEAAAQGGQRVLRSEPTASEADLSFAGLSDLLAGVLPRLSTAFPGRSGKHWRSRFCCGRALSNRPRPTPP